MRHKKLSQQRSPANVLIVEEETQPLPALAGRTFRAFLIQHHLSILDVALEARVRLLTVWNIERENPVSRQHAEMVCAGLYRLTGFHYRGRITLFLERARQDAQARDEQEQPVGLRREKFL